MDSWSQGVSVVCLCQDMSEWLVPKQGWCQSERVQGTERSWKDQTPLSCKRLGEAK